MIGSVAHHQLQIFSIQIFSNFMHIHEKVLHETFQPKINIQQDLQAMCIQ